MKWLWTRALEIADDPDERLERGLLALIIAVFVTSGAVVAVVAAVWQFNPILGVLAASMVGTYVGKMLRWAFKRPT